MPKADTSDNTPENYIDSPIAWFAELLLASNRCDVDRATEAKGQLSRLGWTFRYRRPRPEAKGKGMAQ